MSARPAAGGTGDMGESDIGTSDSGTNDARTNDAGAAAAGAAAAGATGAGATAGDSGNGARIVTVGSYAPSAKRAARAADSADPRAADSTDLRAADSTGLTTEDGRFPYKLIATDLDGTLLRADETISDRTRAALEAACARGSAHIVVTGRAVPWTRHILDDLGYQGLAVCGQGAQVYHAGEHRLLTSVTLDRQLAGLALAKIEAEVGPLHLAASRDGIDGEVLVGPGYRVQEGPLPVVSFTDPAELWSAPLNKVYVQHPGLSDDALAAVARQVAGDLVGVTMAGAGVVELLPLGLSKATGLSLAARRLGAKAADTIAFGDMPNDLPMFGWAAHGVAMANAHEELKAVADEVTGSNEDDGIADVLERLLG